MKPWRLAHRSGTGEFSRFACVVPDSYLGRFQSDLEDRWCFEIPLDQPEPLKLVWSSPDTVSTALSGVDRALGTSRASARWRRHSARRPLREDLLRARDSLTGAVGGAPLVHTSPSFEKGIQGGLDLVSFESKRARRRDSRFHGAEREREREQPASRPRVRVCAQAYAWFRKRASCVTPWAASTRSAAKRATRFPAEKDIYLSL